ncbi:hypothetical protein [Helicobacter rodentium]|nr:hypothetical protein [Helicobacter rodentium]
MAIYNNATSLRIPLQKLLYARLWITSLVLLSRNDEVESLKKD